MPNQHSKLILLLVHAKYEARKLFFFAATENIVVMPGGTKESVSMHNYYNKNWAPIKGYVGFVFSRKKLPIQVLFRVNFYLTLRTLTNINLTIYIMDPNVNLTCFI